MGETSESGLAIGTRRSREQINLGETFRRSVGITGEGICRAKMSKRKRGYGDSISVLQKQKQLISEWPGCRISLNPRFADVRAMWP